jgi:hypothetical protein
MEASSAGPSEKNLARVQAISGLVFATFLVLHLVNTALAPAGQAAYDGFQRAARRFYQIPVIEAALILAASVHWVAGAIRVVRRWRRGPKGAAAKPPWRIRLHRWSGYYLLLALYGHVLATRGGAWFYGMPADFSFLTFSLRHWPLYFYPYYALLFASGFYHLVHGAIVGLRLLGARLPASLGAMHSRPFWAATAVGALLGALGVAALGGLLFGVDTHRFAEFYAFWDRYFPKSMRPWVN